MKKIAALIAIVLSFTAAMAQDNISYNDIKDIIKNEKEYYRDIVLHNYLCDDPGIRVNDYAIVYYGQVYLPDYKGGNDKNIEELKNHAATGDDIKRYETAKKILEYNPASLTALFNAWQASEQLIKPESETKSYLKKYLGILNMITTMGDGKSSKSPYRIISPDDEEHILNLYTDKVISKSFDADSKCRIITVQPSEKFTASRMYIDISSYLTHTTKK